MDKLKGCPFCGNNNLYVTTYNKAEMWEIDTHQVDTETEVICNGCGMKFIFEELIYYEINDFGLKMKPIFKTKTFPEVWNQRAVDKE